MKAVENWLDFILLTEGQSSLSGWDGALPIHQEQVKKLQISDQKLIVQTQRYAWPSRLCTCVASNNNMLPKWSLSVMI